MMVHLSRLRLNVRGVRNWRGPAPPSDSQEPPGYLS